MEESVACITTMDEKEAYLQANYETCLTIEYNLAPTKVSYREKKAEPC